MLSNRFLRITACCPAKIRLFPTCLDILIFTVEFRLFEYSIFRNSRFFVQTSCVPLGFASVRRYNFTPNFLIPRFFYCFEIILLPFKNLNLISRTLKIQKPSKTSFSYMHSWISIQRVLAKVFSCSF